MIKDQVHQGKAMKIDANTAVQIEEWFEEGKATASRDSLQMVSSSPYEDGSFAHHWWTRGYSYEARLLRAIAAENELQGCVK